MVPGKLNLIFIQIDKKEENQIDVQNHKTQTLYERANWTSRENMNNPYCGDILAKYKDNYPVWAFMEIIPFGRFIKNNHWQLVSNRLKY